jgi:hypothetical protein
MSFLIGLLIFVVVIGIWDSRLPWPTRGTREGRP